MLRSMGRLYGTSKGTAWTGLDGAGGQKWNEVKEDKPLQLRFYE